MKQILVFSLLLLSFSSLNAQSKNALRFMDEYKCVAHQNLSGKFLPIEKWANKDTLYYKIEGEMVHLPAKSLKKYLLKLEDLTGIAFCETRTRTKANILMYFGDIRDYFSYICSDIPASLTNNFDNWSNRTYDGNKTIKSASFCVDPKKTRTPDRCRYNIKRAILKSMGLWGQSADQSSIFYKWNTKNNLRLHKNDMKIIKLHYNSNINAGMSPIESRETLVTKIDVESLLNQKL